MSRFCTKLKSLLPAVVLLLAACGQPINPQPQAGEVHDVSFEWHIVDRSTLEAEYRKAGMPLQEGDRLHGFTGVRGDGRTVVYSLPPKSVDDSATCTLGHEVLHITHGSYHP